ncbi:MAG: DUF6391 domain-containing protein [Anaerolineae bacterium]
MALFDRRPIVNIRRNHGLEHATIHVLSGRIPNLSIVGRSDWSGFTLYGEVDTADVEYAAHEAIRRLRAGQAELAVHPRCGTMLATTGMLTGLAAFLTLAASNRPGRRFRWSSLPEAMLAATLAAIVSQPVGLVLQERFTTSGEPGQLEIAGIRRAIQGGLTIHRVETRQ